jgi:hypothetical protein
MRRKTRLRDILLVWPLLGIDRARKSAEMSARRRRADYRRPGSLTYNRMQADRLYQQARERDGP